MHGIGMLRWLQQRCPYIHDMTHFLTLSSSGCQCNFVVVGRSCLIFAHDGDSNFDLSCACVLDTELLTLRNCGNMIAPPPEANFPSEVLPKCAFSVVGFRTCFFPTDASMRVHLEHAWVTDTNLGMVRKAVSCAPGCAMPPPMQCVQCVVGTHVVVFPHDERQRLDLSAVCVLDSESAVLRTAKVDGEPPPASKCQLLVVQDSILIIPDEQDLARIAQVTALPVPLSLTASLYVRACAVHAIHLTPQEQ
jgi:hypothetical protein